MSNNTVNFKMKQIPAGLTQMNLRITDLQKNEIFSGTTPATTPVDIGDAGSVGQEVLVWGDNFDGTNKTTFKSFVGYTLIEGEVVPPVPTTSYDTIVGVGDSISQGEYDLSGGQFDAPYRGVNFKTGANYGTTIQQMIDNVVDFTSQAEGNTLFIVRAGINDCNTYLSAGGVGDGASGSVLSWDDMSQHQKDSTFTAYRELIALLKEVGDVALATITYCDAKGQLLALPDKGRDLHSGSWNDNTTVPLCQELTPDWFDNSKGRPIFDYYSVTYDNPSTLDNDNLHYYADHIYTVPKGLGFVNGAGSYTIRQHTIKGVGENTGMSNTPFNNDIYSNRVLINIGRGNNFMYRPSLQRWANNLSLSSSKEVYENLMSYNGVTAITLKSDYEVNGKLRGNLYTSDQAWHEGVADRNNCSSSIYFGGTESLTHTIMGVTKGMASMIGIFSTSVQYDSTMRTIFEVEDDTGIKTVEVSSSLGGSTPLLSDCIGEVIFDSSTTGILKITPRPASGSPEGVISSICLDLE